ncbi:MAG: recombinase family protein [Oscillospiraceae bacterium]|jgi:DNA invertase Pin-like site-specific DNA recombinase|nr:recombinase family protein [Oscillospiraceae bacterium]
MARVSRKPEVLAKIAPEVVPATYNTAIYVRLSVLDSGKKESESIYNQREMLERYIAERPDLILKDVFTDNGESGVDFARPAWNELIRKCKSGKVNCIIIKDLSRLGRNYIETGEYLEKILPFLGVRLIAINDNYDSLNLSSNERIATNLKNLINDIYAKDISRKSSAALRMKQKQGAFIGSYAKYGYLKDPNNKNKLVIDHETAPIVVQMYEWKADGVGNAQICRRLNEMRIPPPNKYRLLKGIVKSQNYADNEWTSKIIKRILTSQVYLGHMVQGRENGALFEGGSSKEIIPIVYNTHEPIVSQDLFDRANAIIETRSVQSKDNRGKYADLDNKPDLLLKDLLFCADCGKLLIRYKKVDSRYNRVYRTYQCPTHNELMTCSHKYIHEKDLYDAVYMAIRIEIQKFANIREVQKKINRENSQKSRLSGYEAEIESIERELRRISSLRQAIYEEYATKQLTKEEYQFAVGKYTADTERLNTRLKFAKSEKAKYKKNLTTVNKWLTTFTKFIGEQELTAELAQTMVERVEISDYNKVAITFKFRDEYEEVIKLAEVSGF